MPRIPEEELARLKRETNLVALVRSYGVELKPHGSNLLGRCPLHNDNAPSLVVTPEKNLWHCMGACQAGGSVIDWVMKAEAVSFRLAVELLRRKEFFRDGLRVVSGAKRSSIPKLDSPLDAQSQDPALLNQVMGFYHATLKETPKALRYLEGRGLKHPELIDHFRLGFSNRMLGYRLPMYSTKAGTLIRGRLQKLGILRATGHEHFSGSLVIPVFDEANNVVEAYGRKIVARLLKRTPRHVYLRGPHKGVWNLDALKASKEIILCEALIDALTFWCAGYHNVTASYGIEGFTKDHLEAFKRHKTERVLIAYDRDEAGDRAAAQLADKLTAAGVTCYRIQFPKGMDANEYALKVTPASESLGLAIRKAAWFGKGKSSLERSQTPVAVEPQAATKQADKEEKAPRPAQEKPELTRKSSTQPQAQDSPSSPPALGASPEPPAPRVEIPTQIKGQEIIIRLGDRRYRVRGLSKNMAYEVLKVNLLCARADRFHVDTLDLYNARHRAAYLKQAATELGLEEDVLKTDLGKVLLKLEELQEKHIRAALEPRDKQVVLSPRERAEALDLLRDPRLLDRILADFERCGIVGEQTNKLMGYLAVVSRKLDEPLALIIQSSTAAGKSALLEAILAFVPEEERIKYSAMTGQSLFYMGAIGLKHKVLAIVEEEGAERASYALKLLQSEGELTIASTGKDPATSKLVTHEYRVEGPAMLLLTTTAIDIDEELLNRCVVLSVDEERNQTRAIHRLQREHQTLKGLLVRSNRGKLLKLHQNAQRLLRPVLVANPYARQLTFLDDSTRTRRDHLKYLTLIRTIALLYQYQRPIKSIHRNGGLVQYIEVTLDDIALANRLAHEVLGRSLDELPPQTRALLDRITHMVRSRCRQLNIDQADYRFTRKDVRQYTGTSHTRLRKHLDRLVELEYLLVHRGARGQSFVYELLYRAEGQDGKPFLMQLLDVEKLRSRPQRTDYDSNLAPHAGNLAPLTVKLAPSKLPQNTPKTRGWHSAENAPRGAVALHESHYPEKPPEKAQLPLEESPASYPVGRRSRRSPAAPGQGRQD